MMDVQREALAIETEMEKRFSDMLHKNSQRRYLPKSLTEEILEHKQKLQEQNLRDTVGLDGSVDKKTDGSEACDPEPIKYGYAQIREAVTERLGGPFDYTGFQSELRELCRDVPKLQREYKMQAEFFAVPDLREGFQRVPPYKFSLPEFEEGSSIFTVDPIFGANAQI